MSAPPENRTFEIRIVLLEATLNEIAERTASVLRDDQGSALTSEHEFLSVDEAAAFIRAKRQRIYDLLSSGRLTRYKDGRRVLLARSEIQAYLAEGGRRRIAPLLPPPHESRSATRLAS